MRSYLFVPADSERKLARGSESGADALILDLEDSVAADRKAGARDTALAYLKQTERDHAALAAARRAGRIAVASEEVVK